jgi:hypothetical protein
LPDDYLRKLKQDLTEADAIADPSPRLEPDPDAPPPSDDTSS